MKAGKSITLYNCANPANLASIGGMIIIPESASGIMEGRRWHKVYYFSNTIIIWSKDMTTNLISAVRLGFTATTVVKIGCKNKLWNCAI